MSLSTVESLTSHIQSLLSQGDLSSIESVAEGLIDKNWIVPLLIVIQSDTTHYQHLRQAIKDLMECLQEYVHRRLSGWGWSVQGRGYCAGEYIYRNRLTGALSSMPEVNGGSHFAFLQSLSMLITPGSSQAGDVIWAVKILKHSKALSLVTEELQHMPTQMYRGFSILDVVKCSDFGEYSEDANRSRRKRRLKSSRADQVEEKDDWIVVRQLVEDTWRGPNAVPAMEVVVSPLPSDISVPDLETWHETTLAAMLLASVSISLPYRCGDEPFEVLLLGASLHAVGIFFKAVTSGEFAVNVTLVEEDEIKAESVMELFSIQRDTIRNLRVVVGGNMDDILLTEKYDAVLISSCALIGLSVECLSAVVGSLHPWGILACGSQADMEYSCMNRVTAAVECVGRSGRFYELVEMHSKHPVGFVPCVSVHWPNEGSITTSWWQTHVETLDTQAAARIRHNLMGSKEADLSMDVSHAQATNAVVIPALLSESDALALHSLAGKKLNSNLPSAARLGREVRSRSSSLWEVLFLHTDGAFAKTMSDLRSRLCEAVQRVDETEQWGLLKGGFSIRAVEYHTQLAPSEGLGDSFHYDQDSLITLDIMLSSPGDDFEGGEVQTLERDGNFKTHRFGYLDALCFVSHKYHSVRPLLKGRRSVCVIEFWRGSQVDRTCPHRCLAVRRRCPQECEVPTNSTVSCDQSDDMCLGSKIPFRLAASAPIEANITDSVVVGNSSTCASVCRLSILWQAADASDGVDDRRPVVISPLDELATKAMDSMFGESDDEEI